MVPSRIAAAWQAAAVPVILTKATAPVDVWLINGHVQIAVGAAYVLLAVAAFAWPLNAHVDCMVATIGVTFWTLRAATLLALALDAGIETYWAGAMVYSGLALFLGLYYYRTIFRLGFHQRFHQLQSQGPDGRS